jgi:hypothetical protein
MIERLEPFGEVQRAPNAGEPAQNVVKPKNGDGEQAKRAGRPVRSRKTEPTRSD